MSVTPFYTALLAMALVVLSLRVALVRRGNKISMGDAGDANLSSRIRIHGNFTEYVPMALLVMLMAEMQGASAWILHLLGLALVLGRGAHAYALSQVPQAFQFRFWGMIATFSVLFVGALVNLWLALV